MTQDDPSESSAERLAKLAGKALLNTGKQKLEDLREDGMERLQQYQDDPELIEEDMERLADESIRVTEDVARRTQRVASYIGDDLAEEAGWNDADELLQTYGVKSLPIDAYDTLPDNHADTGRRIAFERFAGDEFDQYMDAAIDELYDESLSRAVALRSAAYLREEDRIRDGEESKYDSCDFVEFSVYGTAEQVADLDASAEIEVDFYEQIS